jgi:pyrroline-5-carboxylate reductase
MIKTITFIGNGNMALSIARGLADKYKIEVVGRNRKNLDQFEDNLGIKISKYELDNFNIEDRNIILCVKPTNIISVGKQLKGKAKAFYSVLAGTSLLNLKKNIQSEYTIRAMPNLGASVGYSMTTLVGDLPLKEEALVLFKNIGKTLWLNSEKELDIATGLAGSGPAYLALIAEALTDGAVKEGLKRSDAMEVMRGLMGGFGILIQDIHPAILKDAVMSPGGTTAAGYSALEEGNVRYSCIKAVQKAVKKAREL